MINPAGPGWKKVYDEAKAEGVSLKSSHPKENLPLGIFMTVIGSVAVYTALFATGYWIYGKTGSALVCTTIALLSTGCIAIMWKTITGDKPDA